MKFYDVLERTLRSATWSITSETGTIVTALSHAKRALEAADTRRPRLAQVLHLLQLAFISAIAATASFADAQTTSIVSRSGRLTVTASPGVANQITTWTSGGRLYIQDIVQLSAPGSACSYVNNNTHQVSCSMPTHLRVKLKDGHDVYFSTSAVPTDVRAGSGDDAVVTSAGDDYVQGGGGHDYIATGSGVDRLLAGGGDDYLDGGPGPRNGVDSDVVSGGVGLDTGNYARRRSWPDVTYDYIANDGESDELDNAKVDVVEKRPFNFDNDSTILPPSEELFISQVWSGSSAAFGLETQPQRNLQAVAYYNTDGLMTVAVRRLGEGTWQTKTLPTLYPKPRDGHRSIAIAFDRDGRLHVAGNMHGGTPMQYFRTNAPIVQPSDVTTLAVHTMIGDSKESSVTYPQFPVSRDGTLKFIYRQGSTDHADWYVNEWNGSAWQRTNGGAPIFNGDSGRTVANQAGAYYSIFEDSTWTHLLWSMNWRDANHCNPFSPVSSTVGLRCQLSYTRTRDWRTFYDAAGRALPLPMTPETMLATTLVDEARSGGLFWTGLALDGAGNPLVGYVRNYGGLGAGTPADGGYSAQPEFYLARFNGTAWESGHRLTSWGRVYPGNVVPTTFVSLTGPHPDAANVARWYTRALLQDEDDGNLDTGWLRLDPTTLATTASTPVLPKVCTTGNDVTWTQFPEVYPLEYPSYRDPKTNEPFKILVRRSAARGTSGTTEPYDPDRDDSQNYYYLRWEMIDRGSQETDPPAAGDTEPPRTNLTLQRTSCAK